MKRLLLGFIVVMLFGVCSAQTIYIEITGVRSNVGQLLLGVYTNQKQYETKEAILKKTVYKHDLVNGTVTAKIEGLPPGTYGMALMDDEDMDRKMAFRFFLPAEGFAFSNYYHTRYSKPLFDDFKFTLGDKDEIVVMKLRYLYD